MSVSRHSVETVLGVEVQTISNYPCALCGSPASRLLSCPVDFSDAPMQGYWSVFPLCTFCAIQDRPLSEFYESDPEITLLCLFPIFNLSCCWCGCGRPVRSGAKFFNRSCYVRFSSSDFSNSFRVYLRARGFIE